MSKVSLVEDYPSDSEEDGGACCISSGSDIAPAKPSSKARNILAAKKVLIQEKSREKSPYEKARDQSLAEQQKLHKDGRGSVPTSERKIQEKFRAETMRILTTAAVRGMMDKFYRCCLKSLEDQSGKEN